MKDLFSGGSKDYAKFRPTYPAELYSFIYHHLDRFDLAWDVGTGNGQVAVDLARRFLRVRATEVSRKQLENARAAPNIIYSQTAEVSDAPADAFDLITVGQAIHWFDREKFYREVERVAKANSLLAVWGYGLLGVDAEIDRHLKHFYREVIGPYWDPERKHIDERYQTIAFPFKEIKSPPFQLQVDWSLDDFAGYLNTWSSVQKFIQRQSINPVADLIEIVGPLWGSGRRSATFPLFLRLGQVR